MTCVSITDLIVRMLLWLLNYSPTLSYVANQLLSYVNCSQSAAQFSKLKPISCLVQSIQPINCLVQQIVANQLLISVYLANQLLSSVDCSQSAAQFSSFSQSAAQFSKLQPISCIVGLIVANQKLFLTHYSHSCLVQQIMIQVFQ